MQQTATPEASNTTQAASRSDAVVYAGLAFIVLFFAISGVLGYSNARSMRDEMGAVMHTHETLMSLSNVLSLVKDAETGQRGYIMTGRDEYLEPYTRASAEMQARLDAASRLIPPQSELYGDLTQIKAMVNDKMEELAESIEVRRSQGYDAALKIVTTDRGKAAMDALRKKIADLQEASRAERLERLDAVNYAYRIAVVTVILSALIGIALSTVVAQLLRRNLLVQRRQDWLQKGQVGLSAAIAGDLGIDELGQQALGFLAGYFGAQAGAFFVRDGGNFQRVATYGVPANAALPAHFDFSDGLLGRSARDGLTFTVDNLPDNYLSYGTALGQAKPKRVVVAAAAAEGVVSAVYELGFAGDMPEYALELLRECAEVIATAVRAANYRANLQRLLEETQRQSEELQAQSEELRVNNEELEEQSRALKESQARLEQQQLELEQTNAQLEEQAQQLELQRDELQDAKDAVTQKAHELAQSSQYKSDFLANMSHELRTPLNSSLILARLLAENPKGNLSDEQVQYAQTIEAAGNDLLHLINDILDLSKIEAGHMEIHAEQVSLARLGEDLLRVFRPIADQKGLALSLDIAPDLPKMVETDRQRLEQVLKNLLSNACKFTEKGGVTVTMRPQGKSAVAFAVTDTGIGISEENRQAIFDAFRQADGTISRKYGGTGLGLSISRELVRLLGGEISLESKQGQGSTFTVTVPLAYAGPVAAEDLPPVAVKDLPVLTPATPAARAKPARSEKPAARSVRDDRDDLQGRRAILIVEDDITFAHILRDLAHEHDFRCIIAGSAAEALDCVREYMPSAVILDLGLPDNSGLTVLDRLKSNARTRHIPVHVVSANDYTETAMSLGAVGYNLKPVKRDELVTALEKLEDHLSQGLRRVLIVEDDKIQREAMQKLIGTSSVETVAVGSAAECIKALSEQTYDCMVLDLSLPDASGYSPLEELSRAGEASYPPVIVYTGRDLSAAEEQRLRRYSHSIIIKGAKSPERLLDEVTLFLHQVVSDLPAEQQRMIREARHRDAVLENRRILVVEDDIRNVYALTNVFEPRGASVQIARNGREALEALEKANQAPESRIDLVLMDVMMPEMDGLTATRELRKRDAFKKLPVIMLTAKAMKDDQERCISAGANDYMPKPLDVEKLLSLVRVWMPR